MKNYNSFGDSMAEVRNGCRTERIELIVKINRLRKENMQLRNKISECRKRLRQLKGKDYKQVKERLKLEIENCKMMIKFNEETIKELRERLT